MYPPHLWATYFMYGEMTRFNTNNNLESFFRGIKLSLPHPPPTIDIAVEHLYKISILQDKEIIIANNRVKSKFPDQKIKNSMDDLQYRLKKNCILLLLYSSFLYSIMTSDDYDAYDKDGR
jgi:hypothetical protein